jgi:VanZ family protein
MLGVMYYFSSDVFSGENTRSVVDTIVHLVAPDASGRTLARLHFYTRKSAHFIEYAILAVLLFRAFRAGGPPRWRLKWAAYSMAVVLSWALVDEFHQGFTRHRGASLSDSLLDSCGGLFAMIVVGIACRIGRRQPE